MSKCTSDVLVHVYECCKCPSVGVQCLYKCTSVVSVKNAPVQCLYKCTSAVSVLV